jgi:hypothetical protein
MVRSLEGGYDRLGKEKVGLWKIRKTVGGQTGNTYKI